MWDRKWVHADREGWLTCGWSESDLVRWGADTLVSHEQLGRAWLMRGRFLTYFAWLHCAQEMYQWRRLW